MGIADFVKKKVHKIGKTLVEYSGLDYDSGEPKAFHMQNYCNRHPFVQIAENLKDKYSIPIIATAGIGFLGILAYTFWPTEVDVSHATAKVKQAGIYRDIKAYSIKKRSLEETMDILVKSAHTFHNNNEDSNAKEAITKIENLSKEHHKACQEESEHIESLITQIQGPLKIAWEKEKTNVDNSVCNDYANKIKQIAPLKSEVIADYKKASDLNFESNSAREQGMTSKDIDRLLMAREINEKALVIDNSGYGVKLKNAITTDIADYYSILAEINLTKADKDYNLELAYEAQNFIKQSIEEKNTPEYLALHNKIKEKIGELIADKGDSISAREHSIEKKLENLIIHRRYSIKEKARDITKYLVAAKLFDYNSYLLKHWELGEDRDSEKFVYGNTALDLMRHLPARKGKKFKGSVHQYFKKLMTTRKMHPLIFLWSSIMDVPDILAQAVTHTETETYDGTISANIGGAPDDLGMFQINEGSVKSVLRYLTSAGSSGFCPEFAYMTVKVGSKEMGWTDFKKEWTTHRKKKKALAKQIALYSELEPIVEKLLKDTKTKKPDLTLKIQRYLGNKISNNAITEILDKFEDKNINTIEEQISQDIKQMKGEYEAVKNYFTRLCGVVIEPRINAALGVGHIKMENHTRLMKELYAKVRGYHKAGRKPAFSSHEYTEEEVVYIVTYAGYVHGMGNAKKIVECMYNNAPWPKRSYEQFVKGLYGNYAHKDRLILHKRSIDKYYENNQYGFSEEFIKAIESKLHITEEEYNSVLAMVEDKGLVDRYVAEAISFYAPRKWPMHKPKPTKKSKSKQKKQPKKKTPKRKKKIIKQKKQQNYNNLGNTKQNNKYDSYNPKKLLNKIPSDLTNPIKQFNPHNSYQNNNVNKKPKSAYSSRLKQLLADRRKQNKNSNY